MGYQSEAELELQFIDQLNKQGYSTVFIPDYDTLVENFKVQFETFNADKLDNPLTDKEWERILNLMFGKSVFQSAKILRDKFVLEREDGTKVYLSFFSNDHTKNIFQVTHQTTVVGKYVNRYDVTLLVNGLPLIQVELKRRGIDIREAVNQVMRYKKHSYNGLYKSKYMLLYSKQKADREVVSVLNDVDFCIELMESDRINVAYIMNLIRNIHFDDAKQKDYDIKHIKDELGRTDNPQLLKKVEILQSFLDTVVAGLNSADEIDAAYNDFENAEKQKEIEAFAQQEDIDSKMLTDFISEYEFSGTMDAGNIRDRLTKPMPLLKKRSLVNRIVEFIRKHAEKYQ